MGKFRKSRGRNRSLGKKRTLRGGAGEETTPDPRSLSFDDMVRQGLSLEDMVTMYVELYTKDFPLAPAEEIQRFKKLTRDELRAAEKKRKREKLIRQVAQRDYEQARAAGVLSAEEVEELNKRLGYDMRARVGGKSRTKRRRTRTKRRKSRAKRRRTRH